MHSPFKEGCLPLLPQPPLLGEPEALDRGREPALPGVPQGEGEESRRRTCRRHAAGKVSLLSQAPCRGGERAPYGQGRRALLHLPCQDQRRPRRRRSSTIPSRRDRAPPATIPMAPNFPAILKDRTDRVCYSATPKRKQIRESQHPQAGARRHLQRLP